MKLVIAAALMLAGSPSWALTVADKDIVEKIVNKTIKDYEQIDDSGVGVSIFNSKNIIFQKGFGFRDRERKLPVDMHTAFAIGSTTKAFTTLGVKLLENNGQLKITDKVTTYLSDFKLSNQSISEAATIEDLLSHRIGLPRHDLMTLLTDFSRNENYRRMQYLGMPADAESKFRKTFSYNNLLFMVAGKVIEEVSGESFENYIQEKILDKLSMNETFLTIPQNYSNLAEPYYKNIKTPHVDISDVAPAGSLYSTPADMTKWVQSFMNKNWQDQSDLFNARIGVDNKAPSLKYGYGLGWIINKGDPRASWIFHVGNINGFTGFVLFSPELDLGMVVLVNQNTDSLGDMIATELIKFELSRLPVNKSFNKKAMPIKFESFDTTMPLNLIQKNMTTISDLKTYEDPGYGVIETFKKDNLLFARYYGTVWELKELAHPDFNYSTDLIIGAETYDFAFNVNEERVLAPFESQAPFVNFKRK